MPYIYGALEDQLLELLSRECPDYDGAEQLIRQGADINKAGNSYRGNLLAECIDNICYLSPCDDCLIRTDDCRTDTCEIYKSKNYGLLLEKTVSWFLNHGFDVDKDDGKYGAACLYALSVSTNDVRMLNVIKMMLDAGARDRKPEDEEGLTDAWDSIESEQHFQDCCECNHHLGNLFEAAYQIYQAVADGRPYRGIDSYEKVVGKEILSVLSEQTDTPFFDIDLPNSKHQNCYRQRLFFIYKGGVLYHTSFGDFWTDTVLPDTALMDVSAYFPMLVGHKVERIRFQHKSIVEGKTYHGQPITIFENELGEKISFTINFGEVKNDEDRVAYYVAWKPEA